MRVLTLVLYTIFGVLLALFAARNWDVVSLRLWGDYVLAIRLPVLLLLVFLLGALPLSVLQSVTKWRMRRRMRKLEAQIDGARAGAPAIVNGDRAPLD